MYDSSRAMVMAGCHGKALVEVTLTKLTSTLIYIGHAAHELEP